MKSVCTIVREVDVMSKYSLNDIAYDPEPVTLLKAGEEVDPDWDEEASLERSRKNREIGQKLLEEFRERVRTGQLA